jgi:rubrerythrin/uncharacterized membrane protein
MSSWECGVCGYVHKEGNLPEKCPVCEGPKKMFSEILELQESQIGREVDTDTGVEKKWRCSVSGYLHTGAEPPEKCPICEATAEMFDDVTEEDLEEAVTPEDLVEKRWRCTVCGYVHIGEEPPETCPVCAAPKKMFVEIDGDGKDIGEVEVEEPQPVTGSSGEQSEKAVPSLFEKFASLVLKFHLHPIMVHFPNGILPAVVVFLGLAMYFKIGVLETAAYYNLIFVLVMLPMVMLTGYIEWQKRYRGTKTAIFIVKILCSLVVLASVNLLVFWRLIDPGVAAEGSPSQLIYLGVACAMLGAAGIAGHLGGKLAFASRG